MNMQNCWFILYVHKCYLMEKAMAPHSSPLAWKIPWMEEPGKLQSMGLLRVIHDWATSLSLFTFMRLRRKCQPTPMFLPGESQGRGAWWAAVCGVAQSWTWLKQLSHSSSYLMTRILTIPSSNSYVIQCVDWVNDFPEAYINMIQSL